MTLGMSQREVLAILGEPELRRPEGQDQYGNPFERFQYNVIRRLKEAAPNGDLETTYPCGLVFLDGALVRVERGS